MIVKDESRVPELLRELDYLDSHALKAGIMGEEDSELIMIAATHEFGATIKPKNSKYLAIPLPAAGDTRPADHDDLFVPRGTKILAKPKGQGEKDFIPMFVLLKSVMIPERSYIRSTFDENKNKINEMGQDLLINVLEGKLTGEQLYNRLGLYLQTLIQRKIKETKSPANSALTVANKGTDNPLIQTGRLRNAVTYEVVSL
ncbi:conserved hypothetical protein [Alkaliphilus metalliredigens QYMF]|uniref:Uncharacterized protein n=1 Tax=Alkaliphilus metalliredigens (strain QYMF) TaxID=293826 RepID=A6TKD3_ALKMQ|nr:hypothetical protein [Alkaliphilus metalliredigens]ABR46651.1 conserved hypothetical protein [Alkaliphilus metalliredigens QYMF]ABR48123.1 conserved hypothetical protein [Alkaliphilus metalliredigens QYMF]ABR50432.1 conserved hypothetical protein [Alkaliphilus metalliredigens QYMF]